MGYGGAFAYPANELWRRFRESRIVYGGCTPHELWQIGGLRRGAASRITAALRVSGLRRVVKSKLRIDATRLRGERGL